MNVNWRGAVPSCAINSSATGVGGGMFGAIPASSTVFNVDYACTVSSFSPQCMGTQKPIEEITAKNLTYIRQTIIPFADNVAQF